MLWLAVLMAAQAEPLQTTLDNGLVVTVVADMAMSHLVVQHWIMSGSASDPLTKPGLAHLVEHLMVRDSGLETAIAGIGGQLSAYTAPDYTRFTVLVAAEDLAETLRIITPTAPDAATLASARRVVSEELAQRGGYTARLRAAIDAAFWREHPYAAAASWMLVDPGTITAADCADFITAHYQPGQTHLIIVGPVTPEDTLKTVREHYGDIISKDVVISIVSHSSPEQIVLKTGPSAVRLAGLIYPLPPTGHPDQPILQFVLRGLPEAAPGLMPGALSAGGHISWGRTGSRLLLSGLYSALRNDERIKADLDLTAAAASDWLTAAHLEDARASTIRLILEQRLDPMSYARWLGWSAVMRGEVRSATAAVAHLESLTLETVSAVWKRWIASADPIEVLTDVD